VITVKLVVPRLLLPYVDTHSIISFVIKFGLIII
jgi:hypothetical protein